MSKVILPRITDLIKERKRLIDSNLFSAKELGKKIQDLRILTEEKKREASEKYQTKLDDSVKIAAENREKMISELKIKIETITNDSRQNLKNFIEKSSTEIETAAKDLAQRIEEKLFQDNSVN